MLWARIAEESAARQRSLCLFWKRTNMDTFYKSVSPNVNSDRRILLFTVLLALLQGAVMATDRPDARQRLTSTRDAHPGTQTVRLSPSAVKTSPVRTSSKVAPGVSSA